MLIIHRALIYSQASFRVFPTSRSASREDSFFNNKIFGSLPRRPHQWIPRTEKKCRHVALRRKPRGTFLLLAFIGCYYFGRVFRPVVLGIDIHNLKIGTTLLPCAQRPRIKISPRSWLRLLPSLIFFVRFHFWKKNNTGGSWLRLGSCEIWCKQGLFCSWKHMFYSWF